MIRFMGDAFYQKHAFSANHPELRPGERWIYNCSADNLDRLPDYMSARGVKFYRIGKVGYSSSGFPAPTVVPVFVRDSDEEMDY